MTMIMVKQGYTLFYQLLTLTLMHATLNLDDCNVFMSLFLDFQLLPNW
jgi:hypothetical protein